MKRSIGTIVLIICLLCAGCNAKKTELESQSMQSTNQEDLIEREETVVEREGQDYQIFSIYGEFPYNVNDKNESVGAHDYVFSATVTEVRGMVYPLMQTYVSGSGEEIVAPGPEFTDISITVTEVIKGDLSIGMELGAYKEGGYNEEENEYYLYDNDVYPEEGQEYLVLASKDSDGIMWISAPNAMIPLGSYSYMITTYSEETTSLDRQSIMETYVDAYENEIPYEAETYEESDFPEPGFIGGE